jgi:DNA-binding transcriptional LysR family regulator
MRGQPASQVERLQNLLDAELVADGRNGCEVNELGKLVLQQAQAIVEENDRFLRALGRMPRD